MVHKWERVGASPLKIVLEYPPVNVRMRQLDCLLHTFLNNPSFKFGAAEFVAMNACLDVPRNALSNGDNDEASRPIIHLQ